VRGSFRDARHPISDIMGLRPYQQETLTGIAEAHASHGDKTFLLGVTATPERSDNIGLETIFDCVVVLPCGGGKTVIMSNIPKTLGMKPTEQMLVLVHRDELVWQSKEKLQRYNPTLLVGVEKAEHKCNPNAHIIVASVQTIGKNRKKEDGTWEFCKRIQKFDPKRFRYILTDECHHAVGGSYQSIYAWFDENHGIQRDARLVCARDLRELIEEGWLAPVSAYRIDTHVDLDKVDVKYGEFVTSKLSREVNTPERNQLIVREYQARGCGRKAIAFTVDVQHTHDLVAAFREEGILAYGITGDTPTGDEDTPNTRKWVYKRYSEGAADVLVSCNVLQEGFDQPIATVGLMSRPTKSGLLYRQMIGRVLRPFPAPEELQAMLEKGITPKYVKSEAIILDFSDSTSRHHLHTVPTLFGLRPDYNAKGGRLVDQVAEMERIVEQKKLQLALADVQDLAHLKSIAEKVDLFAKPVIPEEVAKHSKLAWFKAGPNSYQIVLDREVFRIQETGLGKWKVSKSVKGVRTEVGEYADKKAAFAAADAQVPADQAFKVQAAAQWRAKAPTDAQIDLLWKVDKKLKAPFAHIEDRTKAKAEFTKTIRDKYNSGDVSLLIQPHMQRIDKFKSARK
jgi:superfamily II DNA or RNA helicase